MKPEHRRHFGKARGDIGGQDPFSENATTWPDATADDIRAAVAEARAQHDACRVIRHRASDMALSTADLAVRINVKPAHLRRVLRGEAHLPMQMLYRLSAAVLLRVRIEVTAPEQRGNPPQ